MDATLQKQLFDLLEEELTAAGLKTAAEAGSGAPQIGDGMQVLLAVTERAVPALMELMVVHLPDGADLLQMYTTLSVPDGGADRVREALPGANFYCPVGSFGLFHDDQLYHKHTLVLGEDQGAEALCQDAMNTLMALYNVLDDYGGRLLALAEGRITLEQAQGAGLLPKL